MALLDGAILLLLFLLSLLFGAPAAEAQWIAQKPMRNVCTAPYLSMAICGPNGTTDASGYEPEVCPCSHHSHLTLPSSLCQAAAPLRRPMRHPLHCIRPCMHKDVRVMSVTDPSCMRRPRSCSRKQLLFSSP